MVLCFLLREKGFWFSFGGEKEKVGKKEITKERAGHFGDLRKERKKQKIGEGGARFREDGRPL